MKNYIKIFIIGLLFINTGCMNIDVDPENSVTFENFFKEEKDYQVFLNDIKRNFKEQVAQNGVTNIQTKKGFYADEVYEFTSMFARKLDYGIIHTPNTFAIDWTNLYQTITGCNILLENIEKAEFSQERIEYYAAQAYFYRAFIYYRLVLDYGEAPISLNSRQLGMKAKSSTEELIAQVVSDMQSAIKGLPDYKEMTDDFGKPTTRRDLLCKESAYAVLGHIYAWEAAMLNKPDSYQKAIDAVTMILKQTEYYDLAATPEEVCTQVLKGTNHKESVFEVPMGWAENQSSSYGIPTPAYYLTWFPIFPTYHEGDIESMEVAIWNETIDEMFPPGDLRRDAYFYKTDEYRTDEWLEITQGYAFPYKFRDVLVQTSGASAGEVLAFGSARILFRVTELLLLRAECYARSNQEGLAIADLNRVRSRANAQLYGATEEPGDLRYTIFKEREKELLWECYRYYDVIRNGYYGEISETYEKLTEQEIKDGAIYLPVPSAAFRENPLMIQNKYWLSKY